MAMAGLKKPAEGLYDVKKTFPGGFFPRSAGTFPESRAESRQAAHQLGRLLPPMISATIRQISV